MSINFTLEQEQYIQRKLQDGKYHSAAEVLSVAFQLLDDYDRTTSAPISKNLDEVSLLSSDDRNSLTKLFGCIKTDIHDVADRHDHYIEESLRQDLHVDK